MISVKAFAIEMKRMREPDPELGSRGLHVASWMLKEGKLDNELAESLYSECGKGLLDDDDLHRFVDWMLGQNSKGVVRYFPKLSELKSAIQQYCATQKDRQLSRRQLPVRSWIAPAVSEASERMKQDAIDWWMQSTEEERERVKRILVAELLQRDEFAAHYLEERPAAWDPAQLSPLTIAYLMDYRSRSAA